MVHHRGCGRGVYRQQLLINALLLDILSRGGETKKASIGQSQDAGFLRFPTDKWEAAR